VAVVCDLFFHNGVIRDIQQMLGAVGVTAATLAGPILGGLWIKAKMTTDRERRKAWELDDKWFVPLGGRYATSDYEPKGKVYIRLASS